MKVVLDTNVLVSGVFFGGQPGKILKAWRDGEVLLVLSDEILKEYIDVLGRLEKQHPPIEAEPIIELILAGSKIVSAPPLGDSVSSDPDDDKFIACAIAAKANVVVSGDKHLVSVDGFKGLAILKPSEYVKKYL